MKKYIFLILINLSYSIQAQQSYDDYSRDYQVSEQNYYDDAYQNNQEKKSTPSKDAMSENAPVNRNNQDATNQERKSTPSGDASGSEEKQVADNQISDEDKKDPQKLKSPHTFTSNVSLVSDYRFRGISQTMRRPAIQGGFDYSHAKGIYLGTWASNVDGTTHFYNNTSMEWDLYGGYKSKSFLCYDLDFTYNLGFLYYYYPGGKTKARKSSSYNTGEFYIEVTYKWLSIKYWQTVTNYFGIESVNPPFNWKKNRKSRPNGNSHGSMYIEANATFDLYDKLSLGCIKGSKLNLLLHVAHQTVRHYKNLSYTDWRVTLTQEFEWFNIFIAYVGTDAKRSYFDVLDNAFHPHSRHLGSQEGIMGLTRVF